MQTRETFIVKDVELFKNDGSFWVTADIFQDASKNSQIFNEDPNETDCLGIDINWLAEI